MRSLSREGHSHVPPGPLEDMETQRSIPCTRSALLSPWDWVPGPQHLGRRVAPQDQDGHRLGAPTVQQVGFEIAT